MIHITSITRAPIHPKANVRVAQKDKQRIHCQLANEIAEEKMSREIVSKHNRHVAASRDYHQTGERA